MGVEERCNQPRGAMITYTLDLDNKLVDVGGDWETFARENQGESLTRDKVLGAPLFRFVSGPEVVMLYKALFAKVRSQQQPLSFAFRCDSPTCRRRMKIHIEPRPHLGLSVRTELLEEEGREEISLLRPDFPRTDELIQICCICSDVRSEGDTWIPIEEESARRRLLEGNAVPRISHGFCPRCLENQLKLLEVSR